MSPRDRARAISIALSVGAAAVSVAAMSCIKEKDSLVVVAMTAEVNLPGPLQVRVSVGGVSQTFDIATGLSATTPTQRGVYVDSKATGTLVVNATTQAGTNPCVVYTAPPQQTVVIGSAGETKPVSVTLVHAGTCGGNTDAGAGGTGGNGSDAGGSLTLATCQEFEHSAGTDCTVAANDATIFTISVAPSGTLVASAGDDGRVKIWRFDGHTLTAEGHVLQGSGFAVSAFSPDGSLLAVGWATGIDIWSVATWTRLRTLTTTDQVFDLAFTPDGQQIMSIDRATLYAHAVATAAPLHTMAIPEATWALAVSPVATTTPVVAVATQTGTVKVFTHSAAGFVSAGPIVTVSSTGDKTLTVKFSPDGKLLAAAADDTLGTVHVWNYPVISATPTTPDIDVDTPTESGDVNGLDFHPSGKYLGIAGGFFQSMSIFNTAAPRAIVSVYSNPSWDLLSIAFSPNGAALIGGENHCGLIVVCAD